jgi:hypothetical protein
MKDARISFRNIHTEMAMLHQECSSDSDDELLLSSEKNSRQRSSLVPKRSASPTLRDEYTSRSDSPPHGRALKRIKRDADVDKDAGNVTTIKYHSPSAHARSASQPNMGGSLYAQYGLGEQLALTSRTPPVVSKDRAHSVPAFPSFFAVPHIDLRNPPPSPRRARSQSPSKEREIKLRITSVPVQVTKLQTITDDAGPDTHTSDTILAPPTAPPSPLPTSLYEHARANADKETLTDRREVTYVDSVRPSTPNARKSPSTPATPQTISLTFPLSPLTPLPPTPLPSGGITSSKDRYKTAGWSFGGDQEDKVRCC